MFLIGFSFPYTAFQINKNNSDIIQHNTKNNKGSDKLAAFILAEYVPRKIITGAIIYMSNLAIVSLSVLRSVTDKYHSPMIT